MKPKTREVLMDSSPIQRGTADNILRPEWREKHGIEPTEEITIVIRTVRDQGKDILDLMDVLSSEAQENGLTEEAFNKILKA